MKLTITLVLAILPFFISAQLPRYMISSDTNEFLFDVMKSKNGNLYACGLTDGGTNYDSLNIYVSDDLGASWTRISQTLSYTTQTPPSAVRLLRDSVLIIAPSNWDNTLHFYKWDNNGLHIDTVAVNYGWNLNHIVEIDAFSHDCLLASFRPRMMSYSHDGGASFHNCNVPLFKEANTKASKTYYSRIATINDSTAYLITKDAFYKTTDTAKNWTKEMTHVNPIQNSFEMRFISPDTGFIWYSDWNYNTVLEVTYNAGQSWTNLGNFKGYQNMEKAFHAFQDGTYYLLSSWRDNSNQLDYLQLNFSSDYGYSWSAISLGQMDLCYFAKLEFLDSKHGFLVGWDENIYEIYMDSLTVNVEPSKALDHQIELYPNPTSNVLKIQLANLEQGYKIRIVNSVGAQIMSFVAEESLVPVNVSHLPQGVYFIEFRNSAGCLLSTERFIKN
jgi:photosystem II stability/assembly factor-like uncharacterized protein